MTPAKGALKRTLPQLVDRQFLVDRTAPGEARFVERELADLGYEVLLAESGEEAQLIYKRRALEGKPVSVILMDMTLPGGMSGEDSTREILRHDPFAPPPESPGRTFFPKPGNREDEVPCPH